MITPNALVLLIFGRWTTTLSPRVQGWSLALQSVGFEAKYDTLKSPENNHHQIEG